MQQLEHLLGVALGRYLGEDVQQRLVRANHKSRPLDAPNLLAIHVLFFQHTKLIADFLVYISKECVGQVVLGAKLGRGLGRVAADAQHHRTRRLHLLKSIAETAGLDGAAGRVSPGVKEQHDGLARVVREAYSRILIGLQREVRNFLIQFHGEIPRMLDGVTINLHYSRAGLPVSARKTRVFPFLLRSTASAAVIAAAVLAPLAEWSQYPGQVTKDTKSVPVLRAVAVLEWTGEAGKPKACRIVPVTVFDGEKLQDGGIYLARPQPLALTSDVEYELKMNGKSIGLFDVKTAGQEQGGWVGHGDWKPTPKPKIENAPVLTATDDEYSDKPVLHRKHHADDAPSASGKGTGSGSDSSSAPAEPSDPARPTLHKHDSGQSTTSTEPAPDPDRPTLHQKNSDSANGSDSAPDPDRPP